VAITAAISMLGRAGVAACGNSTEQRIELGPKFACDVPNRARRKSRLALKIGIIASGIIGAHWEYEKHDPLHRCFASAAQDGGTKS